MNVIEGHGTLSMNHLYQYLSCCNTAHSYMYSLFNLLQIKGSHADLSLPPQEQPQPTNQNHVYKRQSNSKPLPFKPLSSVHELVESQGNKNGLNDKHTAVDRSDYNLRHSPYTSQSVPNKPEPVIQRQKSRSNLDLRQTECEINNNKMGGVLGQQNGRTKNRQQNPRKSNCDMRNNNSQEAYKQQSNVQRRNSDRTIDNGGFQDNHPDIIQQLKPNKKSKETTKHTVHDSRGPMKHSRSKHDSGFASEPPLSSDEMYDSGFKQELSSLKGSNLTSSPKSTRRNSDKRQQSVGGPFPQTVRHEFNGYTPASNQHVRSMDNVSLQSAGRTDMSFQNNDPRQYQEYQKRRHGEKTNKHPTSKCEPRSIGQDHRESHPSQDHRPRSSESKSQVSDGADRRQRKSFGDVNTNDNRQQQPSYIENIQPVVKTKSLGDLSQGCTFSLVGQKKYENPQPSIQHTNNVADFTGMQMMRHIRKYKEISQKDKHVSLPMKGRTLDDMDSQMSKYSPESQASEPTSNVMSQVSKGKLTHYGSLQHLPISANENHYPAEPKLTSKVGMLQNREQTPVKPRRCLPQTPGDIFEKKKQMSDLVKTRMSVSSRCSTSSPGSTNSYRASSVDIRTRGVSATPSDREVCALLQENRSNTVWRSQGSPQGMCNTESGCSVSQAIPGPTPQHNSVTMSTNDLRKANSLGSSDYHASVPPGGRLSESGQTTLTSQSTIDSGYTTTDVDNETLSSSSYVKSLQQSAQNLFKRHSQKGDNTLQLQNQSQSKGDNDYTNKGTHSYSNNVKDSHSHTKTWLENHPGTFMNDHYKLSLNTQSEQSNNHGNHNGKEVLCDRNNNKSGKSAEKYYSELDLTQDQKHYRHIQQNKHQSNLTNQNHAHSTRDIERAKSDSGQLKPKGKSVSMSHGLNLISGSSNQQTGPSLSLCQPKFTGSLKDLIGVDKEIVPIETLKLDSSVSTLPGNWKFHGPRRTESSLKLSGKPSLFQLLQNYNLYAVRLRVHDQFVVTDNLRMIECEVVLPSPWMYGKDGLSATSPKGSVPKLGGPNSAFKPVFGGATTSVKSVSMVTILDISPSLLETLEPGQLQKGDLIVEVRKCALNVYKLD